MALSEEEKDGIGILTSLLVRFPELCSVNYFPCENSLKLVFILQGNITEFSLLKFSEDLKICIRTYLQFEKKSNPQQILINFEYEFELTRIVITRDIDSFLPKEISMMVHLLNAHFNNLLICDDNAVIIEEALLLQDDYIKCMLDNLRARNLTNKIIALREEGRVLVFKH